MFVALGPLMTAIGNYAHNYASSRDEILALEKENPKFGSFLASASVKLAKKHGFATRHVVELLALPMQVLTDEMINDFL